MQCCLTSQQLLCVGLIGQVGQVGLVGLVGLVGQVGQVGQPLSAIAGRTRGSAPESVIRAIVAICVIHNTCIRRTLSASFTVSKMLLRSVIPEKSFSALLRPYVAFR